MKRRKKTKSPVWKAFVRGFVATGLIVRAEASSSRSLRDSLRRALKGGFAVATGTFVSEGLLKRDHTGSAMALAAGSVCLALVDHYLTSSTSDRKDWQNGKEDEEVQQG